MTDVFMAWKKKQERWKAGTDFFLDVEWLWDLSEEDIAFKKKQAEEKKALQAAAKGMAKKK